MPRLPQIIADQVPQGAPISVGAAQLPGEAYARFGSAVTDIGQEMAQKQIELQRTRQLMDATSTGALAANSFYQDTIADPNVPNEKLSDTVQKGLLAVHDKIAKGIKDPVVRQRFDENFTGLTIQHVVQATSLAQKREISASVATLNTSNETLASLAVDHTGQQLDSDLANMEGNLSGAVAHGMITSEQAQAESHRLRTEIYTARFVKEIRNDPFQAYKDLEGDTNLGPLTRQDLLNRASTELEAQQRQALAQQDRDEREREKAFGKVRDSAVAEMVSRARNGQLTLPDLEDQRRNLDLDATQYDLIRNFIEKGPDHPSDPQKLLDYTITVNSSSAGAGLQTKLARDYSSGALARDDYWQLQTRLAENLKRSEETDGKIKGRQAQAEQMLRADFGVTSPLDQITGASKSAYSIALEELTKRSAAFGGAEDPLAIEPQIRGRYAPIGLFATKQSLDRLRSGLPFKTIQDIGTREQAKARGMSDAEYNQLVHRISELDQAEQDLVRIGGK